MTTRQHGTYSRYNHGCHCDPCREAMYQYKSRYFLRRERRQLKVPSIGAIRRIRALQAIGWDLARIAAAGGWAAKGNVLSILKQDTILASTHDRIDAAYEALSGTPGPSIRSRRRGEREGWAPPLAWDDIDSPTEQPSGVAASVVVHERSVRAERIRRMAARGMNDRQIAAELGLSRWTVIETRRARGIATPWGRAS